MLWGAAVCAVVLTGCAAAPEPVVTRLPTDGTATTPTPTATPTGSRTPTPATVVTAPPVASATPSAVPVEEGLLDCGGSSVTLAGSAQTFRITGDCPDLRVEGNGVLVVATSARVGTVIVSGDRMELQFGDVGGVTVQGNDITTLAGGLGSGVVRGDRNRIEASRSIAGVVLAGNDNTVTAPTIGSVDDQGQRNTIG